MYHILDWDARIFTHFNRKLRCSFLDQVIPRISFLGGARCSILTCLIMLWAAGTSQMGKDAAFALAGSHLVVQVIKRLVSRLRPYLAMSEVNLGNVAVLKDYSFPSGHTTAVFALSTVISAYFPAVIPVLSLVAFAVGFSRIYAGMHYPTDVLIGALIGVVSGILFVV